MPNDFERNAIGLFRSVMSLYEGAETRVRMNSVFSEECEVKLGVCQGSVLSLIFSVEKHCCH